jgi:hypothetical protein
MAQKEPPYSRMIAEFQAVADAIRAEPRMPQDFADRLTMFAKEIADNQALATRARPTYIVPLECHPRAGAI